MAARSRRSGMTITPGNDPPNDPPANGDGAGDAGAPELDMRDDERFEGPPAIEDPVQFGVYALRQAQDTGDMSILSDARFAEWAWHIFRLRGADEPSNRESGGNPRIWCDKQIGPLDLSLIQSKHGGGVFEIWCKDPSGVLRRKFRQEIAGPRKRYAPPPAEPTPANLSAPVPAAPGAAAHGDTVLRMLERQGQVLEQLLRERNTRKEQSAGDVLELAAKIAAMSHPRPQESAGDMLAVLKEGMQLQAQVSGGGEASTTAQILEKSLPVIERVLTTWLTPRKPAPKPQPRPAAAAVPVTESSATVIEEPTPAEEPVQENHRMTTAVEACARSLAQGQPPEDFAVTLENILNEQELGLVRMATPDMLLSQMRAHAGGQFPILEHESALPFITGVLAELNTPPEE